MGDVDDRVYALLPVVHRQRDEEVGEPLRALLSVIADQVGIVEQDIERLYENWFIETCDDWVLPYLGDLVGYRPAPEIRERGFVDVEQPSTHDTVFVSRREVANTLRYRRRKGSLALLELLANDIAGWPARAVEFYRLAAGTQGLKHRVMSRNNLVDLRFGDDLDRLNTPFDELPHTVDVRRLSSQYSRGRYHPAHVGLFVWRLRAYPVGRTEVTAVDTAKGRYRFDAFDHDVPLYTLPIEEPDATHIADEFNLPVPIPRRALRDRLADYYGEGKSFCIWRQKDRDSPMVEVKAEQIVSSALQEWTCQLEPEHVAVDPALGRIVFREPQHAVTVSYHYGFSADIGGGEYARPIRQPSLASVFLFQEDDIQTAPAMLGALKEGQDALSLYIRTHLSEIAQQFLNAYVPTQPPSRELLKTLSNDLNGLLRDEHLYKEDRFQSANPQLLQQALDILAANPQGALRLYANRLLLEAAYSDMVKGFRTYTLNSIRSFDSIRQQWQSEDPRHAVIEFTESGSVTLTGGQLSFRLKANQSLHLRAANTVRPVLHGTFNVTVDSGSRLVLDGILIDGSLTVKGVQDTTQAEVLLRHCTLVPGKGQEPAPGLTLTRLGRKAVIESSIVGPVHVSQHEVRTDPIQISVVNSIIDAGSDEATAVGAPNHEPAHAVFCSERSTILGQVRVHAVDAAVNTIFSGLIYADRRQRGEMRFCHVPAESRTPSRHHCQPDAAEEDAEGQLRKDKPTPSQEEVAAARGARGKRVRPSFTSRQHGDAAYCQLAVSCPVEIGRGAEDEGELGVFHDLQHTQRLANLEGRLNEYIPAGMEARVIVAS